MSNTTFDNSLPPLPTYTIKPLPPLIPGIPDQYLTLALIVVAYWAVSGFFHLIDSYDLFPQYRLHTPTEVLKRNHVSRWDVFRDVIIQQVVQTLFGVGLNLVEPAPTYGKEEYSVAVWAQRIRIAQRALPSLLGLIGVDAHSLASKLGGSHEMLAGAVAGGVYPQLTQAITVGGEQVSAPDFASWELRLASAIYWIGIPIIQFVFAVCVVDTWQYFLHRAMHMNKWLYVKFHSRHHRLYVPYAYGALYNHPFEGFLLDTLGSGIAYLLSGMTVRQSMCFYTAATIKTVDDHCGYAFPWDPLQHLTSNNAGYHDVHHQSWGIKTNFSQPFFTFWDRLLGTQWTGGDVSQRYERARIAAQRKADIEVDSITGSAATDSVAAPSNRPYADDAANAASTARAAQTVIEPSVPTGKAVQQAVASRQQVLDAGESQGGGVGVLAEESVEEMKAQRSLRRSPRKRTASSGLKGLAGRMGDSLHGKSSGVLGLDSRRD